MKPVLDVDVTHRLGAFTLAARFQSNGRLTALFGPSGSGKTSLVNIIAGLSRPASGQVVVEGETLLDTATGIIVPKHRRRIGYVFQEARLFPHLTVRQNLLFGRWFAPADDAADVTLEQVVDLLGIAHLLPRRPGTLSGGEKQRVAIGRALLARPRLLLMDEPLAALDDARKGEILPYIERLRDEMHIPVVYVSHAVEEIVRLATHVVVLDQGTVQACGPIGDVLARLDFSPRSGLAEPSAILEATVSALLPEFGLARLETPAGTLEVAGSGLRVGQRLRVRILASDVMIARARPEGISALNILAGTIAEVGPIKSASGAINLRLDCHGAIIVARLTEKSMVTLRLEPGQDVFVVVKSVAIEEMQRVLHAGAG